MENALTLSPQDATLIAAAITAIATAVTALMAAVWRWRDRTGAAWSATRSWTEPVAHDGDAGGAPELDDDPLSDWWHASATIAHVGDGPAYRVWAAGDGCTVYIADDDDRPGSNGLIPVVKPGETFNITIQAEFDDWNGSDVVIEWSPPPTRRRRRWLGLRTNRRREYIPTPFVAPLPTSYDGMGDLRNSRRSRISQWAADRRRRGRRWRRRKW